MHRRPSPKSGCYSSGEGRKGIMNVKISGDAESFVREEVASGRYDSPQEVVQEGLRLLHEHETLEQQWRERLNGQIEEGLTQLDRGEGIPGEQAFRALRDMIAFRRELLDGTRALSGLQIDSIR